MSDLRRHIPPLALTWDDETPGSRWRAVDASLLFADISGFTALTERLAARGRIGAEEIIETLNQVFATMLGIGAARGGELLKFGGDALLFCFRGEQHTRSAAVAAVQMRAALRAAAGWTSAVGRLRLSMSVGIHSGQAHLFLVGAPTRELLILGPAATATIEAEKAAEAGQIVLTQGAASRLAGRDVAAGPGGMSLLRWRTVPRGLAEPGPSPGGPGPAVGPDLEHRAASLFPTELGAYLRDRVPDPEHRTACIAFVRFCGADAVLRDAGPARLAELADRTVSSMEDALAAEGVTMLATDIDRDGARFFLASGVPSATEDDDGRMLRALRRVFDARPAMPLQAGVNRGHVFAAEVGIAERAAYAAMGDTTNTAARIMAHAPIGSILAHPAVLERSRTLFATTPSGPHPMKGKAVALLVHDVGAEVGTRSRGGADRLPMVGRDAERKQLLEWLGRALSGAGGVITVSGPTGIGKSRLVREALEGRSQAKVLWMRAEPYGAASPFRVLRDPLRDLLGIHRDTPVAMGAQMLANLRERFPQLLEMAALLGDLVAVDVPGTPAVEAIDPQFRPERLAALVVALLERITPGPLVLVVEEAHWADAASSDLMSRISLEVPGRPWAVIALRRAEQGGWLPTAGTRVELGPLARQDVTRIVVAATQATPLLPHELEAVVERAEGNPLYVEEVTRMALGAGSLAAMPDSLQAATSAQIDQLTPPARSLLRCCSVLGRSFRVEVLASTLEEDGRAGQAAGLGELADLLLPDGPGRLRFRNSLLRDVAYDGLAFRQRARLHRAAGLATERLSADLHADAATLSLHFWRAGDAVKSWRYAQLAGAVARRGYANADAVAQYERALEASRRLADVSDVQRVQTLAVLGELRELAGMLDGSITAFRRAIRLSGDPVARSELLARLARVHERAGQFRAALRVVRAARDLAAELSEGDRDRVQARLDTLMALIRLGQEKPTQAREWAVRAIEAARAADDPETLVQALMAHDYAAVQLGQSGVGECTRAALQLCIEHGYRPRESVARANLGAYAFYAGDWTAAVDWFTSSRAVALAAGNAFGAAETDLSLADILIHQGRLDQAQALLGDAVRVLRVSGLDFAGAYGEMLLARILLQRGSAAAAADRAGRVAAEFAALGHRVSAFEASLLRAEAILASGQPQQALELIEQTERAARGEATSLVPRAQLCRGRALFAQGRLAEAGAAIEAGLSAADEQGLPFEQALLLRERATLAQRIGGAGSPGMTADRQRADQLLAGLGVPLG